MITEAARAEAGQRARAAMNTGPFTVTDKKQPPPGGTPHDYWSMGKYWWPNPGTADGLPYVRRDGVNNPEARDERFDRNRLEALCTTVAALTHGWLAQGDVAFAGRATLLLRTFFLSPTTRMNPSLTYAQSIPGICDGRGIGIIDTACFVALLEHALLLEAQGSLSGADGRALRDWFAAYLDWLLTSRNGLDERAEINNHGTWMDVQLAAFALFTGQSGIARTVLREVPSRRIEKQIKPDGRQPHELARTKSFNYSLFNLKALLMLAQLGRQMDIDLWSYRGTDGRSIRLALEFMRPYADPQTPWPFKQIATNKDAEHGNEDRDPRGGLSRLLRQADGFEKDRPSQGAASAFDDNATNQGS